MEIPSIPGMNKTLWEPEPIDVHSRLSRPHSTFTLPVVTDTDVLLSNNREMWREYILQCWYIIIEYIDKFIYISIARVVVSYHLQIIYE